MQTKRIEGFATFSENGNFSFESGLPEAEPVLETGVGAHQGTFKVTMNASASFTPNPVRNIIPPSLEDVLKEGNLSVKRTSRNFIVKMKFPIIESSDVTVEAHREMWNKSRKAIVAARAEIKKQF